MKNKKPKILLLTGPQGSGNHVFSKCFALHPKVKGWQDLLNTYWINHSQEPHIDIWRDPKKIKTWPWHEHEYHVMSISCPYFDGERLIPNYNEIIDGLMSIGKLKIGIIGRDESILQQQERRVRGSHTYHQFLPRLDYFAQFNPCFLSLELLFLYRNHYLQSISTQIDWPISWFDIRINDILRQNPNEKYVHYVNDFWLDYSKDQFSKDNDT